MSTGDGRPVQGVLARKAKILLAKRRGVPGQSYDPLAAKGSLEHERGATEVMVRWNLVLRRSGRLSGGTRLRPRCRSIVIARLIVSGSSSSGTPKTIPSGCVLIV